MEGAAAYQLQTENKKRNIIWQLQEQAVQRVEWVCCTQTPMFRMPETTYAYNRYLNVKFRCI